MITHLKLREIFKEFWEEREHREVPTAPLVLKEDQTTLFTSSGMQPLVPYLSGEIHSQGKRLYNIQPCFRAVDIEEVGDNRHTTFFEMMGNWSLGDYFKSEQIPWAWEFFTKTLGLPKEKLYVTVFEGGSGVSRDEETAKIYKKLGVADDHIFYYEASKNWWSRAGAPETMPAGEIGGPDSEIFYEFTDVHHNPTFGDKCHPNCDCGRFLEIGNSVFIQYRKKADGSLDELPQKNVDYGGGLERILMAANNTQDVFETDVFKHIIGEIEKDTNKSYSEEANKKYMRVVADHLKAAVFMIVDGVRPSNKEHGYILRRLLRRSAVKMYQLGGGLTPNFDAIADRGVMFTYNEVDLLNRHELRDTVFSVLNKEMDIFAQSLDRGLKFFNKLEKDQINELNAFNLFQSYGFPYEVVDELADQKGVKLNKKLFENAVEGHRKLSRTASAGMFKGGLADQSEQVIKYHTATHLLHQALRDVLGSQVRQEGSNITGERLRFDFSYDRKPTDEEIAKVEEIINQKITDTLPVRFEIMSKEKADQIGALSFFREKYGNEVKVYFVGDYSKEFCGGPHVTNTKEIGTISIYKVEKLGANLIRVYASKGGDHYDIGSRWRTPL